MKRFSFLWSGRFPVMLLAIFAGLALGHLLRRSVVLWGGTGDGRGFFPSADETSGGSSTETAKGAVGEKPELKPQPPGGGGTACDLKELSTRLALAPRVERCLLLAAAVERAPLSQLVELLGLAAQDPLAQDMITVRWAQRNPDHLWRSMVQAFKPDQDGGTAFGMNFITLSGMVLKNWVRQDPQAVVALLENGKGVPNLNWLRLQGAPLLFARDPEATLRLVSRWSGGGSYFEPQDVNRWLEGNVQHVAEVLSQCGSSASLTPVAELAGSAWAWKDPCAALEFASTRLQGTSSQAMIRGVLNIWAARDPKAAAAWIASEADEGSRLKLAGNLVAAWRNSDPAAAMDWAEHSLRGEARADAVCTLALHEALDNMDAVQKRTAAMEPGNLKNKITARLALMMTHGEGGLQKAVDWLLTVPDAAARRSGLVQAVEADYTKDPKQAAELAAGPLAEQLPVEFAVKAAVNFANLRPKEAMDWVETLPESRQSPVRAEAWRIWLSNRPQEAFEWFNKSPQAQKGRGAMIAQSASVFAWQADEERGRMLANFQPDDRKLLRTAVEGLEISEAGRKEAALKSLAEPDLSSSKP